IYIDGVDQTGQPYFLGCCITRPLNGDPNGARIGGFEGPGFNFNGSVDEVAIYTQSLSFAQVLAHYQAGAPSGCAPPKSDQTINFPAIGDKTFGDPDFAARATASSGLDVSYGASGNCSVTGGTVHITGAGSCTVTASQAGNDSFNTAADVSRSFNIGKANAHCTVNGYTVPYDGSPHTATGSCTGVSGPISGLNLSGTTHTLFGTYSDTWTFTAPNANYNNGSGPVTDRITAHVPANKDACKNGGWASLTRANGTIFTNQGDCVSYTNNGK
ncbi:MAG: hypothetical protein JO314_00060, partial [Acidobacteria bacterium]|nr:hypothetical protein [Acidobacteriota bacterium]